jgi:hypothetical protein
VISGRKSRKCGRPSVQVSGRDLPLPKPFKGAILASKPPGIWRNVGADSSTQRSRLAGCWAHRPPSVGSSTLDPDILGAAHDFAGDLRAVFAVCITPRLLAARIIGS